MLFRSPEIETRPLHSTSTASIALAHRHAPILLSLCVLDGPYGNFAGRDASRGLAKNSFDKSMLTSLDAPIDKLEDLNDEEKESLSDWAGHFEGKYQLVGKLIENKD